MSPIIAQEFSGRVPWDRPQLFTHVRDFRFHGGAGRLAHRRVACGPRGYTLVASKSSGHETCYVEHERVSLTLPRSGRLETRVDGRTLVTEPGGLIAIGPSERRSDHVAPNEATPFSSHTIIAPPGSATALGGESWLHRERLGSVARLNCVIDFSFRLLGGVRDASAGSLAHIEALLEDVFLDALSPSVDGRGVATDARCHEWVIRAARAYMETHHHLPMSIAEIAAAIGVGLRTLQLAFRERRGMTPKQLLTEIRLRSMHARLVDPATDTTVTSAALDAGIFHVGRGIGAYSRRYEETPADTLRRARSAMRGARRVRIN